MANERLRTAGAPQALAVARFLPLAWVGRPKTSFRKNSDSPRQIIDSHQQLRWRWDNQDPFGANTPDSNPAGLGNFTYNLRFPGQYYDQETGLFYNVFRDYDPATGRYVESDPIGLRGGLNTYTYVGNNPINIFDSKGLHPETCETCSKDYPNYVSCESLYDYHFDSFNEAFNVIKSIYPGETLKAEKPRPATSGPCSITSGHVPGEHINIRNLSDRNYPYAGSITSCPCCEQTDHGAYLRVKYRVH